MGGWPENQEFVIGNDMAGLRMTTFMTKHGHAIQVGLELAKVGVILGSSVPRLGGLRR